MRAISVPCSATRCPRAVGDEIGDGHAHAGGEHPVPGARHTAALNVPENRCARFDSGAILDQRSQHLTDAAQAGPIESVQPLHRMRLLHVGEGESFGDHHHRGTATVLDAGDPRADLIQALGLLRDQDRVGAAGDPRMQGDPAGVAAITSSTMQRRCELPVVRSRSMASVAISTRLRRDPNV